MPDQPAVELQHQELRKAGVVVAPEHEVRERRNVLFNACRTPSL